MSTNLPNARMTTRGQLTLFALSAAFGLSLFGCTSDNSAPAADASPSDGTMGSDAEDSSPGRDASDAGVAHDTAVGSDAADAAMRADADGGVPVDATLFDADASPAVDAEAGVSNDAEASAPPANIIIADQFNNRVIEIDRQGHMVWHFGDGKAVPSATSIVAPNDCERLPNGQTLMAGTGVATGAGDPACDARDAGTGGCPDNRVFLVDHDGGIVWVYGQNGELSSPVFAAMLAGGNVLIADQGNQRVIEVSNDGGVTWQFGPLGGDAGSVLNNPNSAQRFANGNTLIADESNNRVIEVQQDGGIAWQYGPMADGGSALNGPAFASRLPNGNTLITDGTNNRVVEVQADGGVTWMYSTLSPAQVEAGAPPPVPTRAVRLANGHTLIANQFYHQVFELDNSTPPQVVFTYGQIGVPGNDAGQLNGPYDSKVIGDFTGLTPPQ